MRTVLAAVAGAVALGGASLSWAPAAGATARAAAGDPTIAINWKVAASTHLSKLNMSVKVPPGSFKGTVDIANGRLVGKLSLPPATSHIKLGGALTLATATFDMVETRPVTGKVNFTNLAVKTTAQFDIKVTSLEVGPVPINLVGSDCHTATPITLKMGGKASLTKASTFSGSYTIPNFAHCGLVTLALDAAISGPNNGFSATFTPKK
jgi:hypothetical protein